jgi:transposase
MRPSWSVCGRIGAATLPLSIAVAGRPHTLRLTSRKDRHHDGPKSSNRSYGWVVERSFPWVSRFRRLARDDDRLPATLAGLHFAAFVCLSLPKLLRLIGGS